MTVRPLLLLDLRPAPRQLERLERSLDCLETAPLYGGRPGAKLHRVQSLAGERPTAWLAVDPVPGAHRWAARRTRRGTPTLLLHTSTGAEVTERNVDTLLKWTCRIARDPGEILDIGSTADGPAGALSNFSAHAFVFRGERMASMEGLLQSLKCPAPERQAELWHLIGSGARNAGADVRWREQQVLYWRGEAFDRHGCAYQDLLDEAYEALFDQNYAGGCPDPRRTLK